MQSRGGHQTQQTERLEADRLAAGVRTGDDQRIVLVAQRDVNRHRLFLVEQRMSRAQQRHTVFLVDLRRTGVVAEGQPRLGEDKVQLAQHLVVGFDAVRIVRHIRAQFRENALDFRLFLALKHLDLVVSIHDLRRLDEQRRARGGDIVHHARHIAAVLALDRDDKSSVALGDQALLQELRIGRRGDDVIERLAHARVLLAHLTSDICQLGGRRVGDLLLADDRAVDLLLEIPVGMDAGEILIQRGRLALLLLLLAVLADLHRRMQQGRDVQQFAGAEHTAAVGTAERGADLADAAECRCSARRHHFLGIVRLLQRKADILHIVHRTQIARLLLRLPADAQLTQLVEDCIKFQCFIAFFR